MDNKYSLSDVAAVIGNNGWNNNCGFGGFGGDWAAFLIFLLIFGIAGNGWGGGFGGFGGAGLNGALTRAELAQGFNDNTVIRKLDGITQGLCDGFYAQNSALQTGFCGLSKEIAENRYASQQCCCDLKNVIHSEGEATRALINSNTMQNLRDKLADKDRDLQTANFQLSQQAQSANIINTLRPFPTPSYITCSPYESARHSYACGCGCNCGCGY